MIWVYITIGIVYYLYGVRKVAYAIIKNQGHYNRDCRYKGICNDCLVWGLFIGIILGWSVLFILLYRLALRLFNRADLHREHLLKLCLAMPKEPKDELA